MSGAPRIDQVLAGFADGDAISHDARVLQSVLRGWGIASDIFAPRESVSPSMAGLCRGLGEHRAGPRDVVLHHYSIGSPALDAFLASSARKIVVYHNITPAAYFRGLDEGLARRLEDARSRLASVLPRVEAAWAVSAFNAAELEALGGKDVRVFPLRFDPSALDVAPDPEVLRRFEVRLTTILAVGRVAPNKKLEDLIDAFWYYRKALNPFSRLVIVGSERSCPRYFAMLRMHVADLGLPNVCFEGFASPAGLPAYYRSADVFVSASEHEGYCLPLLEAMHMGVPVVARSVGGVPEALGGAGIGYEGLDAAQLAGLLNAVVSDPSLRSAILASQLNRMEAVARRDVAGELRALLAGFLPHAPSPPPTDAPQD
jgi:glycosyltransferase involved in cell wall biosynthesis